MENRRSRRRRGSQRRPLPEGLAQAGGADGAGAGLGSGLLAVLRFQGAAIMGKTNTPAYCQDLHTDNSLFGPTLNPHDPKRTPGGSSGGPAAAGVARPE